VSLDYVIWLNPERTVMVTRWDSGEMEVALRDDPSQTWGPPVRVEPEATLKRREGQAA
jgi:hypothetical protein